ncbi:hypothetical protein GCM10027418_00730 [Mariniluteicoccus endophyticus]
MAIRIHCADEAGAEDLVEVLVQGGFLAEAAAERFAGEDDDEEVVHVVTTDAPLEAVTELVGDGDEFVEVSDPTTGTRAGVAANELPTEPKR